MMLTSVIFFALGGLTMADLRLASRPKEAWKLRHDNRRRSAPFVTPAFPLYMEPSAFDYQKLKNQRQRNYDNFLRSNIDNEQDNRNFDNEDGKDHLPFRSYETAGNDAAPGQGTIQTKMKPANPTTNTGVTEAGNYITVKVGEPNVVPLRWNNPHAAELEVNIWIMKGSQKYVVPVMKPTCSGSGYQDNVFDFKVPKDFYANVCNNVGDCVLHVYAHSVESRMYSSGTPVVVTGGTGIWDEKTAKEAEKDLAFDLDKLRPLCLSRADQTSHHTNTVLYKARLSSDVYNHAYQNSDFSPYAGQQPQHISQNLQAACILKMTANNFGELGKTYMQRTAPEARQYANKIDKKARKLIKDYEKTTDKIINSIKGNVQNSDKLAISSLGVDDVVECEDKKGYCAKDLTCVSAAAAASGGRRRRRGASSLSDTSGARRRRRGSPVASGYCANAAGTKQPRTLLFQNTATCFRCAETGATTTRRLNTNTYIPSFEIKGKENVNKALQYVNGRQLSTGFLQNPTTGTITVPNEESATLSIYMAVLTEMWKEFKMASDGTYCAKYNCGKGGRRRRRGQPAAEVDLEKYKFTYRGPVLKSTTDTLPDENGGVNRNFKKRDANNKKDGGYYSAAKAWSLQNWTGGSSTAMPSRVGPLARSTMYNQTLEYPPKPPTAGACNSIAGSLMEFGALQEEDEEEEEEVDDEDDVARSTPTVDDAGDFAASLMEGDDVLQKEEEEDDEDKEEDDDGDGAAILMEGDDDEENEEDQEEEVESTLAAVDADGNLERPRLMRTKGDGDLKMAGRLSVGRSSAEQNPRLMRTRMSQNEIPSE
jgi:hypothetical protein